MNTKDINGCTVYVSSLPFSLTNNDLHQIFEKYGKIVSVKILKDQQRRSRGVAFVQFYKSEDAATFTAAVNNAEMFGRTLKASIAKDNGRNNEFLKRRKYPEKGKCYECGEDGHLSYKCPSNVLGTRQPPPKKIRIKSTKPEYLNSEHSDDEDSTILHESNSPVNESSSIMPKKPKFKQNTYLSDEEDISDGE